MSVFQTLGWSWIVVPSLPPWFTFAWWSQLWHPVLSECVFLCTSQAVHIHVVANVIPRSICLATQVSASAGGRTESPDRALDIPALHDQRRVCLSVLLPFLYIKFLKLDTEIAFNNRSAIAYYAVDLLKYPRQGSCSECSDRMLLCC